MDFHEWKFNENAEVVYCWKCLKVKLTCNEHDYGSCFPTKADKDRMDRARAQERP